MIVQRLHEIQDRLGYLPDAELAKVAREQPNQASNDECGSRCDEWCDYH